MKICVTGAVGRLGSHTCDAVRAAGHELVATDLRTRPDLPYHVVIADLLRREQVYPLLEGCDAVIHLGNHPSHYGRDAQTVYAENTTINVNVFQAAWELGLRRVVFASSIQVVGGGRRDPATESSGLAYLPLDGELPPNMSNPYAASKDAGERLLRYYAGLDGDATLVAIRYPAIWRRAYRRREPRPERDLIDECYTWILADDAARLAVAAAEADLGGYRCYQAGCRELAVDLPLAELLERFYQGVPIKRSLAGMTSLVDLEPLERELGWTPTDPIVWEESRRHQRA